MAGTLTHFYVMREYLAKIEGFKIDGEFTFAKEEIKEEINRMSTEYGHILEQEGTLPPKPNIVQYEKIRQSTTSANDKYSAAFLGATGPDIFYMPTLRSAVQNKAVKYGKKAILLAPAIPCVAPELATISTMSFSADKAKKLFHFSDYMHYKNGALFVKNLYEYAQTISNEADKEHVVWLCKGFLSHIATDLVIHPFVNSLVGKYQEHIIQEVSVPGVDSLLMKVLVADPFSLAQDIAASTQDYITTGDFEYKGEYKKKNWKWVAKKTSSLAFYAHNLIEMGQDYYVIHDLWKELNIEGREVMLTHRIKGHIDVLSKAFSSALTKTYNPIEKLEDYEADIASYLDYFVSEKSAVSLTLNLYPDIVLNGKFSYKNAIKHKGGGSEFKKFTERAVLLTHEMIELMKQGNWNDLLSPWNLDTGLKTECKVEENEIKIDFKNYDKVFMG